MQNNSDMPKKRRRLNVESSAVSKLNNPIAGRPAVMTKKAGYTHTKRRRLENGGKKCR